MRPGSNTIESYKASMGGDPLRIREHVPRFAREGWESLGPADKDLLKWLGVFFRRPTPGRFMMRIRMPNGFGTSEQLRAIAELSRRLGNSVLDITTRQQVELRGFTIGSVPEIWEKLRGVNLHSIQTGMDNVRNLNGCPLAGLTPHELLDASPVLFELDRLIVGADGNPEFANLPRKFNITVTGCLENCTHNESQDVALVPARKGDRIGFNILVGGKMGSGGFTIASPLGVFVEPHEAARVAAEIVRIFRDHGPRDARAKCRLAFLIEDWGFIRLRADLEFRLRRGLESAGDDMRRPRHTDHLGISPQKQPGLASVGLSVPAGRLDPSQMEELAYLSDTYAGGEIRFTVGQDAILPNVPIEGMEALFREPLLREFSPHASPFTRRMVACTGTDFCNLAQIDTKRLAVGLSKALEQRLGKQCDPLSIHWSGCPAGCGNHQAADIGLRGMKVNVNGQPVDAVAIYVGGRTGPNAVAGEQILDAVPIDDALPDVVARVIGQLDLLKQAKRSPAAGSWDFSVERLTPAPGANKANGRPASAAVAEIVKVRVCRADELSSEKGLLVRTQSRALALFALDGKAVAMDAACPHAGGPLHEGLVRDGCVVCPLHGWAFELAGGRCASGPDMKVQVYPASIKDGAVWVEIAE